MVRPKKGLGKEKLREIAKPVRERHSKKKQFRKSEKKR